MKYTSIKNHLCPYEIVARRKTTINHAFASAIAPSDEYDNSRIRDAIRVLGQNPEAELICVYCGQLAQTWDHVFATVKKSVFSGYGHRLGNLLPCCKQCNSAKGNKNWRKFLKEKQRDHLIPVIDSYLKQYEVIDGLPHNSPEYKRYCEIKCQVLELLGEADKLANIIRAKG